MSIVDFLIQNHYGCVKFDSNKDKLTKIIPSVAGETGACVLRNSLSDVELTRNYLSAHRLKETKNLTLMTAYEFVEDLDKNFEKYSLLFIDDFQKADFYTLTIMNEWYTRYHKESERLPYLLLGSIAVSYQKIPIPLNVEKVLDLSHTSLQVVTRSNLTEADITTHVDEDTIIVQHSKENYDLGSEELYEDLVKLVNDEIKKYEKGDRAIVYLPNEDRMKNVSEKLSKNASVIQLLPDSKISSPYREGEDAILVILTLDYTRTGIYFPQVTTVFDSGETMRTYTTRTGGQAQFLKKIDREELELRRESHAPKKYVVMIPSESIKNLRKNTIPVSYRINLAPHILHLLRNGITDLSWFYPRPVEQAMNDLEMTGAIDVGKRVTKFGLFAAGLFEEGFDINIYHSLLLYNFLGDEENMFAVIVLVALFQHKTGRYFLSSCPREDDDNTKQEETFQNIYYSLTKASIEEEAVENINKEILGKMLAMIEDLCEVLEVEKRIYNPKIRWDSIRSCVEKVYKSRLCRYEGGKYMNGSGERVKIYGKRIEGNISKIILPISTFRNEKGEYFTDFYVCMKPF